ncbi:class I SAM-dependent methyltransferase [Ovoidimarina sediminis]|uniref:class I SAM-dependent methyltransferase n=1 Tax=Ovoidimarina sediminis TaxID=3079856 RepID=UPI0029147495|nr:methyltransferase domain-containing protein [Rhodophyticola sp. MJ-SS7]MDU8942479.1 methyltransferase domain-containing protein [Rhodophyticola sp. MJ-SS7]
MSKGATKEELEAGRGYEALFVPALFAPWTHHLIRGARAAEGQSVLDVACGSGVLARDVRSRTGPAGRVVGLDPAPGMIAAASEIEPGIEWVSGAVEDLPFEDGTFDCVVSQFGMMFFQDKAKAASEMRRVIKPGGHLAVAVWNSLDSNPAYNDIIAVLDERVSTEAGDALRLPYSLGDADAAVSVFEGAGFEAAAFETRTEQARFPTSRTMVEAELRGWLPLFGITLSEEKIAEVLVQSDSRLAAYASGNGEAVFPTSAHIITAKAPA